MAETQSQAEFIDDVIVGDTTSGGVDQYISAIEASTESQKARLLRALGVGSAIQPQRKAKKQTNQQAKNHVLAHGEVQHPDQDNGDPFSPKPSEGMVANLEDRAIEISKSRGWPQNPRAEVTAKQLATAVLKRRHLQAEHGGATTTITAREAEDRYGINSVDPDDLAMIAQEDFSTDIPAVDFNDIGFSADEGSA
tara:strand:- start:1614 stop:2198 length:585 start_codon:yes stop_codon:yes gene_type:complete